MGTFAACTAAATIQLLHERGWRGSWGFPRQSRDQRLVAYLFIYLFTPPLTMLHVCAWTRGLHRAGMSQPDASVLAVKSLCMSGSGWIGMSDLECLGSPLNDQCQGPQQSQRGYWRSVTPAQDCRPEERQRCRLRHLQRKLWGDLPNPENCC